MTTTIRPMLQDTMAAKTLCEITPSPARLVGLGTAVPELCWSSAQTEQELAELWKLRGRSRERWRRIVAGTTIQCRFAVIQPHDVMRLSTAQRMEAYERCAPPLAERAVHCALAGSGASPCDVTDLIIVSCTGFAAPGLDVALMGRLGLQAAVRRTLIGFMGCFGGIVGLRTAAATCAADRKAVALVVCLELCSLHLRNERSVENQVAAALFADGAAAAVVVGDQASLTDGAKTRRQRSTVGRLTHGASLLLEQGRDWMTWRVTDTGFAMTLSRKVPHALGECLADYVAAACPEAPRSFILHPGGPSILDAADEALQLCGGRGIAAARAVLRKYGNMSSGTVLFVLKEAWRCGEQSPAMLLAFGPGLTIESILLEPEK